MNAIRLKLYKTPGIAIPPNAPDLRDLLQSSIDQLEELSASLANDVMAEPRRPEALPPRKRISKEALLSISVLLPKLRVAHSLHTAQVRSSCASCEE